MQLGWQTVFAWCEFCYKRVFPDFDEKYWEENGLMMNSSAATNLLSGSIRNQLPTYIYTARSTPALKTSKFHKEIASLFRSKT